MSDRFQHTRWTLVMRSRGIDGDAKKALSDLCEMYYQPVVVFLRLEGRSEDVARDLAHDFFAHLLQGQAIDGVSQDRGKFRSFLLGVLKKFALGQKDHARAAKRGGDCQHQSLQDNAVFTSETESHAGLQIRDTRILGPDAAFDRQWALVLLTQVLTRQEKEMQEENKGSHFTLMKPWLTGECQHSSQAELAHQLNMSVDAGSIEAAIAMEDRNQVLCSRSEDFNEGIRAFLEKRKPVYVRR